MSGCLVPLPLEEQVEVNQPPFFAPGRVSPPFERLVEFDPQTFDDEIEFRIDEFGDFNLEDRIYFRWFLNYDPPFFTASELSTVEGRPPTESVIRTEPITFSLAPCRKFRRFADQDIHRIQVLVADRPFLEQEDDDQTRPNQNLPEEAGHFRIVWFLRFDFSTCNAF